MNFDIIAVLPGGGEMRTRFVADSNDSAWKFAIKWIRIHCVEAVGITLHEEKPQEAVAKIIDDGFGNCWTKCGPACELEIVRPGKVQCGKCDRASVTEEPSL